MRKTVSHTYTLCYRCRVEGTTPRQGWFLRRPWRVVPPTKVSRFCQPCTRFTPCTGGQGSHLVQGDRVHTLYRGTEFTPCTGGQIHEPCARMDPAKGGWGDTLSRLVFVPPERIRPCAGGTDFITLPLSGTGNNALPMLCFLQDADYFIIIYFSSFCRTLNPSPLLATSL